MAKCRMLIQENQELGRQLSQGRVAQLEAELALQKKYSDELKGSQDGKNNQNLVICSLFTTPGVPVWEYTFVLAKRGRSSG